MKILDRYILWLYIRFLLMGIFGFLFIYITVDLIDHIHLFLDRHISFEIIIKYYLYQIPSLTILLTPVAVLLACFFTLGRFSKNFEIIAMQTLGVSSYRILLPIISTAVVVFGILFYINEYFVPQYGRKFLYIKEVEVNHSLPPWYAQVQNYTYKGENGDFYFAKIFDPKNKFMEKPTVLYLNGSWDIIKRIDADKAEWTGDHWIFVNCYIREFNIEVPIYDTACESCFFSKDTIIKNILPLESMVIRQIKQDEMSIRELRKYLQRVSSSGGRQEIIRRILVDIHKRSAYPLSAFVIALLGAPLALSRKRSSIGVGFGLSLLISFIYWGVLQIGLSMGYAGTLNSFIAGWGTNIVFIIFGLYLFWKIRK